MPELTGQTVVLIGGSAGIGLETARRARSEEADVVLVGRDPAKLRRARGAELGVHTLKRKCMTSPSRTM